MSLFIDEQTRIDQILKGNNKILAKIYSKVYRAMYRYGISLGLSESEIKESVQDAFELFYRRIIEKELHLSCTIETYIIGIARKQMFRFVQVNKTNKHNDVGDVEETMVFEEQEEDLLYAAKYKLFVEELKRLPKHCQKIIKMTLSGKNDVHIQREIKSSSVETLRTQRSRCKQSLINNIKANPIYGKIAMYDEQEVEKFMTTYEHRTK